MATQDAFVVLRLRDVRFGTPGRVEPVQFLDTQAAAQQEVQRLNSANIDSSVEYGWGVAVAQEGGGFAFGVSTRDTAEDDKPWSQRVLPIEAPQSCAVCDADDYAWVYPLQTAPGERITLGDFACLCQPCHEAVAARDDATLIGRHGPDGEFETHSFADEVLPLFHRSRIGEPLTRAQAKDPT